MEICLSKYTNIISKMKERLFIIKNDELKYKTSSDEENENRYHLDTIDFVSCGHNKSEITIHLSVKNLIINSNSIENLNSFTSYLNLEKFLYKLFLNFVKFNQEEKFRFNIKEYIVNLKQYADKEIFFEIMNNIIKRKEEFEFLFDIIHSKLDNFNVKEIIPNGLEELNLKENLKYSEITSCLESIKNSFSTNCLKEFKEKSKILLNFSNENINPLDDSVSMAIKHKSKELMRGIELIHNNYLNLCRILLELKKSVIKIDYSMKMKKSFPNPLQPTDMINKYLFQYIRTSEKNCLILKEIEKANNVNLELKSKLSASTEKNMKQKETLKIFLSNRSVQIFFCFSCGNIMKTSAITNSTCNIDFNCKNYSNFYCSICQINYCSLCIIEIKNGKCAKGHLMFKFEGDFPKRCILCQCSINNEGYGCNLCNISSCCDCFDKFGKISSIKCLVNTFKFELVWKKKFYSKCSKCTQFRQCHWSCFFCNMNFCVNCIRTPSKEYCGQLHEIQRINLTDNQTEMDFITVTKANKFKSENSRINSYAHSLLDLSCSVCQLVSTEFAFCKRCDYLICINCT